MGDERTVEDKHWIELHGKTKAILDRNANDILILFNDVSMGKLVLTIPKSCILYHTLKRNEYYNLFVELKGVTHVNNGRIFTNNILLVRKAVNKL